jgi:hypothetical protein
LLDNGSDEYVFGYAVLLSIIFESACASNSTGGTSAGNYAVSVTGVSGTIAHSVVLNLTVK